MNFLKNIFRSKSKIQNDIDKDLFDAIFRNNENAVREALANGANPNAITAPRDRPLHFAVDYASKEIFDLLIEAGADVNMAQHKYPCFEVPLSKYAEIGERDDLHDIIIQLEQLLHASCPPKSPQL